MSRSVPATDSDGFLVDADLWTRSWALARAADDDVTLGDEHWAVIRFLRDYWQEYRMAPSMRLLVKALRVRLGEECGSSRFVYRLFPEGAPQACLYAGLPRPTSCI